MNSPATRGKSYTINDSLGVCLNHYAHSPISGLKLESCMYSQLYIQHVLKKFDKKQPHDIFNEHYPEIPVDCFVSKTCLMRCKYLKTQINKHTNKTQRPAS